jgi:beta-lactamase superfamily II metal-dependent hydrolase
MRRKKRTPIGVTLAALFVILVLYFARSCIKWPPGEIPIAGSLQVYLLDVGQGDSLLIVSPGGKHVLVDAGPAQAGDEVVAALQRHGVQSLDLVVATHPHADHIGGMRRVLDKFTVNNFLDSGQEHPTATYERLIKAIKDKGINFIEAQRGQTFELDSGAKLEVLNPMGNGKWITEVRTGGSVENANSIVLRLSYGDFAMIFTGDAEAETEAEMIKAGGNLRAQVLKIGHHGARYATSDEFLRAVQPSHAVISDGADNKYGHPTQETLDRLRRSNTEVFRTDLQGEIAIISDGKNFLLKPTQQADVAAIWQGRQPVKGE